MSVAARALVISLVEGTAPAIEPRQRFAHVAQGLDEAPETARTRSFDLVALAGPVDDGEAAVSSLRWRETLGIRVVYQAGARTDLRALRTMIADDSRRLATALFNPAGWSAAVDNIVPGSAAESRAVGAQVNAPAAWLATLPVVLTYHD